MDLSGVPGVAVAVVGRQRCKLLWLLLHPLLVSCRECKRTQGVSTTDLVGRMLLMTKAHHSNIVSQRALGGRWSTGHVPALPYCCPKGSRAEHLAARCMENGQWQQNNLLMFASTCLRSQCDGTKTLMPPDQCGPQEC